MTFQPKILHPDAFETLVGRLTASSQSSQTKRESPTSRAHRAGETASSLLLTICLGLLELIAQLGNFAANCDRRPQPVNLAGLLIKASMDEARLSCAWAFSFSEILSKISDPFKWPQRTFHRVRGRRISPPRSPYCLTSGMWDLLIGDLSRPQPVRQTGDLDHLRLYRPLPLWASDAISQKAKHCPNDVDDGFGKSNELIHLAAPLPLNGTM
ncbi:hypothetical protein LPU83_pLPU83d_1055 (plasmid) [Rhizobium favelukesii]|uniref:Uncharacterized protein n=1 Tax=Rhizobium favelukesii TaxID=348824 RepID=W6RQL2_9HYPH|nr:hypothetical protein LPU83_pLPU83d_1055 [Rhizobium favelukesii]